MIDASSCGNTDEVCEECGNDLCSDGLTGCMDCVEADPQRDWMKGQDMGEPIDYEKHCKDAIAALAAQLEKNRQQREELARTYARVNSMRDRLICLNELAEYAADCIKAVEHGDCASEEIEELRRCFKRSYDDGAVAEETAKRAGVFLGSFA